MASRQRSGARRAFGLPVGLARDDDVGAAGQRAELGGSESQVLRPMITGQPRVTLLEVRQVLGQVPGHHAVLADHAVARAREDQSRASCVQTATGALIAGWYW